MSLLSDVSFLVGKRFEQKWDNGEQIFKCSGEVVDIVDNEFLLQFPDSDSCYLTPSEVIVDMLNGDFTLL